MKNIIIYTGPVKTGKTTSLFRLLQKMNDADGVLQPVVDDTRCLYLIKQRKMLRLESKPGQAEDIQKIGKYSFLRQSFADADKYVCEARNKQPALLIFDEVGPLELSGNGMHSSLTYVIENLGRFTGIPLFVVR
ncbi:MAG: hypothetical protein HYV28_14540 [Ignavibacteriales bacterium]|nr:hypothetical protein [Ignavibacteriales bacterium]